MELRFPTPVRRLPLLLRLSLFAIVLGPLSSADAQTEDDDWRLSNEGDAIVPAQFEGPTPLEPMERGDTNPSQRGGNAKGDTRARQQPIQAPDGLFGSVNDVGQLDADRATNATSPAADAVLGKQSKVRITSDVGSLLKKSNSAHGVATQNRTPIVTDSRVRGQRVGQVLASGSYWTPARMDLDTMMNKLDSRLIDDAIVIKGPYSGRYGPGFRFVDIHLIQSPRYEGGYETHGSSSVDYISNGEQIYGRQSFWGGSDDWGFYVSYGHRAGSDYQTGAGTNIPSSYKSGDLFLAVGHDCGDDARIEFNYLRLDQRDVEYPGLVYDLDFLGTEGYEIKYFDQDPWFGDSLQSEVWYNRTNFRGDALNPSKISFVPALAGFDAVTNGNGSSFGHRVETTWGRPNQWQTSIGTDLILLHQGLNDIELDLPDGDDNFPIPQSTSIDIGLFLEEKAPLTDWLTVTGTLRGDVVTTSADEMVTGVETTVSDYHDAGVDQSFTLGMASLSSRLQLTEHWFATLGGGYGQRPPTLTELYAMSSFIGSLQRGLTFLEGDPELRPESLSQIDLGLQAKYAEFQGGVHGYCSWIKDFITYDLFQPADPDGGFVNGAAFVNTEMARLTGCEVYGQCELRRDTTLFAAMSYVEGIDYDGNRGALVLAKDGTSREALPAIPPLDSRVGFILHDPSNARRWGIESSARIVDRQDRFAASLDEIATPGFTTYDIRSYRRLGRFGPGPWLVTAGCENLTDKFYREHLDYRSGLGVFRPGRSFYAGVEVTY